VTVRGHAPPRVVPARGGIDDLPAPEHDSEREAKPEPIPSTTAAGKARGKPKPAHDRQPSAAARAIDMLARNTTLWRDLVGEPHATIDDGGRRVHLPIASAEFADFLGGLYFDATGKTLGQGPLDDARRVLRQKARREATHTTFLRVGAAEGRVYYDLADTGGRVVEVDANGWRVIEGNDCRVRFVRRRGMLAQVEPVAGGSLDDLWPHLNVAREDRPLVASWLVCALRPDHPSPILTLQGEQGTGKSSNIRTLRLLVDPHFLPTRTPPKDNRDVAIACRGSCLLAYDNLSGIPADLSDILCTVATGGGFATRALYSDGDEVLFAFLRPMIVGGIDALGTRGDFADRSYLVALEAISDEKRIEEAALKAAFDEARPRVLGALFTAIASALARLECVRGRDLLLPRMADAAVWAVAAAPALGFGDDEMLQAIRDNRREQAEHTIDEDSLAQAVLKLPLQWSDTPADSYREITRLAGDSAHARGWPRNAGAMNIALRRLAPALRSRGVTMHLGGKTSNAGSKRQWRIDRSDDPQERRARREEGGLR
jgi:hypothetical protein